MTAPQYLATLYTLCGLSTLGIYLVNGGTARGWGGWYPVLVLAFAVFSCWPVFFALWLFAMEYPRETTGKRWRAP